MSHHQDLLTTKARLHHWTRLESTPKEPVFTLMRDRCALRVTFAEGIAQTAELLLPGAAIFAFIDLATVEPWMRCSRKDMAKLGIGDRVTAGDKTGTVVGFELEDLRHVVPGKPWPLRLQVVYDDGVDGTPFPAAVTRIEPDSRPGKLVHCMVCEGPCSLGRPACRAWQCGNHAEQMCLIVARATGRTEQPHPAALCAFHSQYGDRRFDIVRVLHDIPTMTHATITEEV
ncbi:hypothetical protein [Nonomuraea basaltis]|uniref:hypothetical protein n=1 Tax=Nonomuraea basaltis TaxID=2495887 RepID=UPI00110C416E|nr:hypothetical protein [Nonomuraea basaltis]TMR90504.1 hypothetical protein EJK15_54965 [Nonomuraea basaltis]